MILNLQTDFLAATMLLIILLSSYYSRVHYPGNDSFRGLIIFLMVLLAIDSSMWVINMQKFPGARILNLSVNYAYYMGQTVLAYTWSVYVCGLTQAQLTNKGKWIHRIPLLLALAFLAENVISHEVFSVSADNIYSRSWGIGGIAYAVFTFYYLMEALVMTAVRFFRSDCRKRRNVLYVMISSALPVLGTVFQMFCFGVTTIWSFSGLALLILHFNMQAYHAAQTEREVEQSRIAVMLSQIQPHFLYNALTGIKALCGSDPQMAKSAMEHFSYFLRRNLDALSDDRLIPFDKEMEHVKDYFYLEKMRFKDRVNLETKLGFRDFKIPPLTLQPLVENAVRYGITKKDSGGTIIIRSEKNGDQTVVTISDDGVGFDPDEPVVDGRAHIGIKNVRSRLEVQCGGILIIESKKGMGTVVRIVLPGRGLL